jgi:hypothetical protein
MNSRRDIAEMTKFALMRNDNSFRNSHSRTDRRNVDRFVMPGTRRTLLVPNEGIRMIVASGNNHPYAEIERADDSRYPTPFHPV